VARAVLTKLGLVKDLGELSVDPSIKLTLPVDSLLLQNRILAAVPLDISASAKTIYTVPDGKRILVIAILKSATVASLAVQAIIGGNQSAIAINATGQTMTYTYGLTMDQGDSLVLPAGNVADTAIEVTMIYREETLALTKAQA